MRVNHVGGHPNPSATKGGKALAEKIRNLNAQFPKPYLLLLNAPHMRQETLEALGEALTFWPTRRQTQHARPPYRTLLGGAGPPLPRVYSLSSGAIQKTRRLIPRLNELPGVRFESMPDWIYRRDIAGLHVLLVHYLGALQRIYADAVITAQIPQAPRPLRILDQAISALVQTERRLSPDTPAPISPDRDLDRWVAVSQCKEAAKLLRQFASLPPEVLSRLRKCDNARCAGPGPYFLQKIGPQSKHCSPKCKSLARTLPKTRHRA